MSQAEPPKKYSVKFGCELIDFSLQNSNRTTLAISVLPDTSVSVVAPINTPLEKIKERVHKRAPWIIRHRIYFAQFLPNATEKNFVAGESFRYLGRQYRLKVKESSEESITLRSSNLEVSVNSIMDKSRIKTLITNWYKERTKTILEARLKLCSARFQNINLPVYHLSIRKMNLRWGSCTKNGRLILNPDLIQARSHCIDYVICHELTHLKVRNHTPEFFRILSGVMPDWELRRNRLERFAF